jgi:uncharacterized protein YggL (DUF469 family)
MSDFNYQEYLKNNPLLKEEVKEEQLITESQEITEEANYSNKDGYMAFADNENIVGTYGVDDAIEFARELAMTHFDAGAQQDKFVDDFMIAYKEAGYDKGEEIQEEVPSSKIKVSELKAKIKEDIISLLQEEEEDEVEVEDEVDVEVDAEEPPIDVADDAGLTTDEQEIQDSLKLAYDNAVAIGDQKLADQIGNSITFFTRTHVVER